jgi:hypothetical protein
MTAVAGLALGDLLALRDLDRAGVEARFGLSNVAENVAYEGLTGVDRLDPDALPAHFFFRGDEQVMLYVPRQGLEATDPGALIAELGEPAAYLRSRVGGDSQFQVWPERGVALSTDGATAEVLEVFAPRPLDAYEADIYRDPGEFIK